MPIYMEITGVEGESTSSRHPRTFEIASFSWGMREGVLSSSASSGRPLFQDITVTLQWALNIPKLMLDCVNGQRLQINIYDTIVNGDTAYDVEQMLFTNCLLTSWSNTGSGGNDLPAVQLTFNYAKVEVISQRPNPTGNFDEVDVVWTTQLG